MRYKGLLGNSNTATFGYSLLLVSGMMGLTTPTYAVDYVIDSAETTTNGGYPLLQEGDSLTITETGSIAPATGQRGVDFASGTNHTVENLGSITTDDEAGIGVDHESTVTNSGSISTTGDNSRGVTTKNFGTVVNSGSISTTGSSSHGVSTWNNSSVDSSGSINTTGSSAVGINASGSDATITHSGTITTTGSFADGVHVWDTSTVTNTGSISVAGNGAVGIYVEDDSSVSNSGSIITQGGDGYGIEADGDNNVIDNSGSISTAGDDADGIHLGGDNNTVVNSGVITVSGDGSYAINANYNGSYIVNDGQLNSAGNASFSINADDNAYIVNNGSIYNENSWGIEVDDSSTVINNGSVVSLNSWGIEVDHYTTVINNGSIIAGSNYGIESDDFSTIINNGTIHVTNGAAIETGNGSVVTNTGSIVVAGTNSEGIFVQCNNCSATVNNSGYISAQGNSNYAIYNRDDRVTNTTLNILAGSKIIGAIDLGNAGGDSDIVNIYSGSPSASLTILNAEEINLQAPGVQAGNTVMTVDATMAGSYSVGMAALASSVHHTVHQRRHLSLPSDAVAVASTGWLPSLAFLEQKPVGWGQIFGGQREQDAHDDALAYDSWHYGINGGYEWDVNGKRLGVMGGLARSRGESDETSFDNEANHLFVGGYGFFNYQRLNISSSLIVGYSDYDNKRFVYDNLNGLETARSETDSLFFSPSITFELPHRIDIGYELRPLLNIAYHMAFVDGYSESGTTQSNLKVEDRTLRVFSSRAQLALARILGEGREVELRLGVSARSADDDKTETSLAGNSFKYSSAGDDSVSGFYGGVSVRLASTDTLSLIADLEAGGVDSDESYVDASLKLEYRF